MPTDKLLFQAVLQLAEAKTDFACYFIIPSILLGIRR